jgi:hypothetical protein
MRLITLLFTLLFWFNAVAVAPYGIKGQSQSGTLYSNVHQFPNNQVTNMGGINALVETGNKNILVNPSFEHSTFSTGWTSGAGSFSQNLTVEIDGLKAAEVTLSAQALAITQDSTLYAAQFADGVQGLASVRVKTSLSGIRVCSRQAGVTSTTNCVNVQGNGKWGLYKVPMILGATSNGISIASNGTSLTGTVYLDDAFVGAVDLQATVDSSRVAGEAYFAGTTSCSWSRTSTSLGSFNTNANCPGPTIAYSSLGQWQTTDSDLPRITINNLQAGVYKAKFLLITSQTTGGFPSLTINDGTTSCSAQAGTTDTAFGNQTVVECTFVYNQSGNRSFEVYGASSSNTVSILNSVTLPGSSGSKFILEYFGSSSVYSSTNADTDWASCGLTGASFTGFGSSVPTPSLQCKRQGSDLLIKGYATAGTTPTAVEARMALPIWNGVQLVSANSSIIPTLQVAGFGRQNSFGNTYFIDTFLIEPSVSYMTFGLATSTTDGVTKFTGSAYIASGKNIYINARIPIEGWQNSNILIGQFNGLESCLTTLDCTDTFSAKVSAAGVVSDENIDWIDGNCTLTGTANYKCNYKSGINTVPLNCAAFGNAFHIAFVAPVIATRVEYETYSNLHTQVAASAQLICQKQGVDYIGKTAKAVASDQNVRVVGATGVDMQSVYFAGATLSTACSTSPCVIYRQVGSKITSVSRVAIGQYNLNGIDGTKYQCTGTAYNNAGTNRMAMLFDSSVSSSTQATVSAQGVDTSYNSIICIGIP